MISLSYRFRWLGVAINRIAPNSVASNKDCDLEIPLKVYLFISLQVDVDRLSRKLTRHLCAIRENPFLEFADQFNTGSEYTHFCNKNLLISNIQETLCKLNRDCANLCPSVVVSFFYMMKYVYDQCFIKSDNKVIIILFVE